MVSCYAGCPAMYAHKRIAFYFLTTVTFSIWYLPNPFALCVPIPMYFPVVEIIWISVSSGNTICGHETVIFVFQPLNTLHEANTGAPFPAPIVGTIEFSILADVKSTGQILPSRFTLLEKSVPARPVVSLKNVIKLSLKLLTNAEVKIHGLLFSMYSFHSSSE